jgi:inhibitor of cysteine peptidase
MKIRGRNPFLSLARAFALVAACFMYPSDTFSDPNPEKASQPMLLITEKDNGLTVNVRLGESIRINLAENASTGYRWAIDRYDQEFIDAIAMEPRYTANAIGSGGEVAFIFKGKKIGSGEMVLKHWRHWEGAPSIINRFCLRLNVRP